MISPYIYPGIKHTNKLKKRFKFIKTQIAKWQHKLKKQEKKRKLLNQL
jgi:hypothetical protein